jgi:hypothetical protein
MLLYHYATEKFETLKTRERQSPLAKEDVKTEKQRSFEQYKKTKIMEPGYYYEHISFMFEPPPLREMSRIFPPEHLAWRKGNKLFEHVVDSAKIGSFGFYVVESPEKIELFYDEALSLKDYHIAHKRVIDENRYIGSGHTQLSRQSEKFLGTTHNLFRAIKTRSNYDDIKLKYAATVPHVMLYPAMGWIKPHLINEVVCG